MLASTTRALFGIPLLLAGGPADLLVLVHQLIFGRAPGRDHFIQFSGHGMHGFDFRLTITFLCRNVESEGLAVTCDSQGRTRLQVTRKVLAKFMHTDLDSFHIASLVYTIAQFRVPRPWFCQDRSSATC